MNRCELCLQYGRGSSFSLDSVLKFEARLRCEVCVLCSPGKNFFNQVLVARFRSVMQGTAKDLGGK